MLLPAFAVGFAVATIISQNFGAKCNERVRRAFYEGAVIAAVVMLVATVLAMRWPHVLLRLFDVDAAVISVATAYLQFLSVAFVANGVVSTCAGAFQGLSNTMPALITSVGQLVVFALPVLWLSNQVGFRIEEVWYVSLASTGTQMAMALVLLRSEFKRKLTSPILHIKCRSGGGLS
jgi:Na+-driven multidrug efflux pump